MTVVVKIFADVGARIAKKEILSKLIHFLFFTVKYTLPRKVSRAVKTAAVFAYDAEIIPGTDVKGQVLHHGYIAVGKGQVFDTQ